MIVVGSWIATLVLHQINLAAEWDPVAGSTWAWIALWLGALALGYAIGQSRRDPRTANEPPGAAINLVLIGLSIVAMLGAALFVYDFAILRGYGFTNAAATIRFEEVNEAVTGAVSVSVISGAGRLMIAALPVLIALTILYWSEATRVTRLIVGTALVGVLFEQVFFEGGRIFLTAVVIVGVLALFVRLENRLSSARFRKFPWVRIAILGSVMLSFFAFVFIERVAERGDFFSTAWLLTTSSFQISPYYDRLTWFEGPLGALWFSISMLWLYLTQGFNELDLLLATRYLDHADGLYSFPQVAQILVAATGIDIRYDAVANLPTYGSYATYFGHSYIDFGNLGSVAATFVLGFLGGRSISAFASGSRGPIALLSILLVPVLIISPVVSLFPSIWPIVFWSTPAGIALTTVGMKKSQQ